MKRLKIVLGVIVVFAIIGAISSQINKGDENNNMDLGNQGQPQHQDETQPNTDAEEKPIDISATNLIAAYDENEVSADDLYKEKRLKVTGEIGAIGKDILGDAYITLIDNRNEYAIFSVQCYFKDEAELDKISDLKPGQIISLIGTCDGSLGNVLLKNCTFAGAIS